MKFTTDEEIFELDSHNLCQMKSLQASLNPPQRPVKNETKSQDNSACLGYTWSTDHPMQERCKQLNKRIKRCLRSVYQDPDDAVMMLESWH